MTSCVALQRSKQYLRAKKLQYIIELRRRATSEQTIDLCNLINVIHANRMQVEHVMIGCIEVVA